MGYYFLDTQYGRTKEKRRDGVQRHRWVINLIAIKYPVGWIHSMYKKE